MVSVALRCAVSAGLFRLSGPVARGFHPERRVGACADRRQRRGKSTLMAVLCGTHDHYEGEICINNQPVSIREPLDAKRLGIHLVQQEVDVALIPVKHC